MRYNGGVLKKNEMKSLLEIRMVIETLAIELAVTLITEEDCDVLEKMLHDFGSCENPRALAEMIFLFHHELCVISGNVMLPLIFYSFKELATMLWERYFQLFGSGELYDNTSELFENLKNRDAEKAIETFRSSLEKTIRGDVSIYYE